MHKRIKDQFHLFFFFLFFFFFPDEEYRYSNGKSNNPGVGLFPMPILAYEVIEPNIKKAPQSSFNVQKYPKMRTLK